MDSYILRLIILEPIVYQAQKRQLLTAKIISSDRPLNVRVVRKASYYTINKALLILQQQKALLELIAYKNLPFQTIKLIP
jgi:hypothetical protein